MNAKAEKVPDVKAACERPIKHETLLRTLHYVNIHLYNLQNNLKMHISAVIF